MYHLEVVPIDFDQEGMKPELLLQECHKKKIKGIYLMPSCNNPIGFQLSLQRRNELKAIISKEKLLVIEDDIHSFLTTHFQQQVLPPFQQLLPDQTIYLSGMTKFICSGLRVAYLVFPERLRERIERAIFNINVKTSGLDAEIITQILHSPETIQKILTTKLKRTAEANDCFDAYFDLPRPSNPYPYYRNIPIRADISPLDVEQHFLNKGIRIYHSNRFTSQQQADPFIRIALSSNHLEILKKGLRIIKEEIDAYL